jgi:hypothetical protein
MNRSQTHGLRNGALPLKAHGSITRIEDLLEAATELTESWLQ